jgi:4-amino-4-deoxy-L-arabinose transferase-like glycosyltransferase
MHSDLLSKLSRFNHFRRYIHSKVFIPLLLIPFAAWFMPIREAFQFDTDEGIELVKATLYSQGYSLYSQIWNDQPPLATVFLAGWLGQFGQSIYAARFLTLLFAALLLWCFFQILRLALGTRYAVVGCLLLVCSISFLRLSVSVMFGLPSLSLALLSVYCFILYQNQYQQHKRSFWLLIVSGIALGLSLQVKLFTIFLIPLIIFEFIESGVDALGGRSLWQVGFATLCSIPERAVKLFHLDWRGQVSPAMKENSTSATNFWNLHPAGLRKLILYPIMLWVSTLLITFLAIGFSLKMYSFDQLFHLSFGQHIKAAYQEGSSYFMTFVFLMQDLGYLPLAIAGLSGLCKQPKKWQRLPLYWLISITLMLLNYRPIWYHHYLLMSIPTVWIATYGIKRAVDYLALRTSRIELKSLKLRSLNLSQWSVIFLLITVVFVPIKFGIIQVNNYLSVKDNPENHMLVERLLEYKPSTHWLFTDMPIYAFYAGINVPPDMAVFSQKRLRAGNMTLETINSSLQTYHPEQILLGRFSGIDHKLNHCLERYGTYKLTRYTRDNDMDSFPGFDWDCNALKPAGQLSTKSACSQITHYVSKAIVLP